MRPTYALHTPHCRYGPGRGPMGAFCPVSTHVCRSSHCMERSRGGHGAGSDHYWLDPCSNYDFQNSSTGGCVKPL